MHGPENVKFSDLSWVGIRFSWEPLLLAQLNLVNIPVFYGESNGSEGRGFRSADFALRDI